MTSMTVNGEAVRYALDPETPLLFALRDASNLTGTKHGCYSRDCGSCTVLMDGQAQLACRVTIAQAEGAEVVTIEGLSSGRAHPLQQAWAKEQVSQCGRCDPGFIMALAGLLKSSPSPTTEQLSALPNICRCGATPRIARAIAGLSTAAAAAIVNRQAEPQDSSRFSNGSSSEDQGSGQRPDSAAESNAGE